MFEVNTSTRLWGATTIMAILSGLFATLDMLLFHSGDLHDPHFDEIAHLEFGRTLGLSLVVAFPCWRWFFGKLLEKNLLAAELRRLVERDRLTDVATRDFFFGRLQEQGDDAYGVSLMIDIDHFKQVNDTHGHLAGDVVIRSVASWIRGELREHDIVCRFGGEEFVVFLHQASAEQGWTIAERIRTAIATSSVMSKDGEITVSVSVGGSMKEQAEDIDDAILRADRCLYRAKSDGRNCTIVDWEITSPRVTYKIA